MKKDIDKRLQDIEEMLETTVKQTSDIYGPKGQKPFGDYKGSIGEFFRERKLRRVAGGKKRLFYNIAGTLTGSDEFATLISKAFDAKYKPEQIEDARKKLEEEFGVKPKAEEPKEQTIKKEEIEQLLKDYFDPINASVTKILGLVEKVGSDAKQNQKRISDLSNTMTNTIVDLTAALANKPTFSAENFNLKPDTIIDNDGKEYLYYPGAPEGRQIYEKGKKGTAGRIASKKTQRKLREALKNIQAEIKPAKKQNLVMAVDETAGQIFEDIKKILNESSAARKSEIENLFEELSKTVNAKQTSLQKMELDEMEGFMNKTLKKALREFFNENPDLLNNAGSAIIPLGNLRNLLRGFTRILGKLIKFGAALGIIAGAQELIVGKAIEGSNARVNKVLEGTLKNSNANEIARLISADVDPSLRAFRVQEFRKIAQSDPELAKKLAAAESIAGTTGVTPVDIKAGKVKPTSTPNLEVKPPAAAQQIIEENKKRSEMMSSRSFQTNEQPAQTVNQIVNQVMQAAPSAGLNVHNKENTFNRLTAQDFDHPFTYSNYNMG